MGWGAREDKPTEHRDREKGGGLMLCLVLEGGQGYSSQARLWQSAASGTNRANVNTVTVSTWNTATTGASSYLFQYSVFLTNMCTKS